jgi:DNA-3-methyladenine glycosylase II
MAQNPLAHDPVLNKLFHQFQTRQYWGGRKGHFLDLVEIVTGQQLSMKAAKSIFDRFLTLYGGNPTPEVVLATPDEKLRSVGFSGSKVGYVKNIASAVAGGDLDLEHLATTSDEEIHKTLTKIKGLGPWSVDMFLIFSLKRPDVFSVGDLGLRSAIEKLYGIRRDDKKAILTLAETWRPHRTLACRLLWSSLE